MDLKTQIGYIGAYTKENKYGIYSFEYNEKDFQAKILNSYMITNPSYLIKDMSGNNLYAVIETDEFNGVKGGAVACYAIGNSGNLSLINVKNTNGNDPCHLTISSNGLFLVTANYSSGSLTTLALDDNGAIGECISVIEHNGNGPTRDRQDSAHVHFVQFSPDQKYLMSIDLGIDRVVIYDYEKLSGKLTYNNSLTIQLKPGSGPRHLAFHPNKNFIYIVTELSNEIFVLEYEPNSFKTKLLQTISTLPQDFDGTSFAAAICVSKDGKYIYTSNRGHDSIAVFESDIDSGLLKLSNHYPCCGDFPRDIKLTPEENYLLCANQNSNNITIFKNDKKNGKLEKLNERLTISSPVCILF